MFFCCHNCAGVNLPAAQLHVAMGIPLHRIPDIRALYGYERFTDTPIDFMVAKPVPPRVRDLVPSWPSARSACLRNH